MPGAMEAGVSPPIVAGAFWLPAWRLIRYWVAGGSGRGAVLWPASHCPHCEEAIRPRDNLPLISYVLLRGQCRNCKEPISARYPTVEATTGLLFGAAAYQFVVSLALLHALVFISALISLAVVDLEHGLLPN